MKSALRTTVVLAASGLLFGLTACSGDEAADDQPPSDETSSTQEPDSQAEDEQTDAEAAVSQFEGSWYLESEAMGTSLDIDADGNVSSGGGGDHVDWEGTIAPNDNGSFTMTINAVEKDLESVYILTATDDPDVWEYVDKVNGAEDVMERQD